jgi:hypothetical protein
MGYMEEDMVFVINNSRGEIASYYFKRLKKIGINIGDITMLSFEKKFNCKIQTFKCCVTIFLYRMTIIG